MDEDDVKRLRKKLREHNKPILNKHYRQWYAKRNYTLKQLNYWTLVSQREVIPEGITGEMLENVIKDAPRRMAEYAKTLEELDKYKLWRNNFKKPPSKEETDTFDFRRGIDG